MNDDTNSNVTPEEAEALRRLQRPVDPPAGLYSSVSSALSAQGSVQRSPSRWRPSGIAAAAAVIAFVAGLKVGEGRAATPDRATGSDYLVLLMNTPAPRPDSTKTVEQVVAEYVAWSRTLASSGQLSIAAELAPQRSIVNADGVQPGSIAEGADGVFVIRAPTSDSAYALARTLPHVRQGGSVSVQPVARR